MRDRFIKNFIKDCNGGVLILAVFALPILVGMAALAVEVSLWYATKQKLQYIADSAAVGAATEISNGNTNNFLPRVQTDVIANGFTPGGGKTLTVNKPPATGAYTTNSNAVEVILTQQISLTFTSLFLSSPITVSARGVALGAGIPFCVLTLDPTMSGALSLSGSGSLTASQCGVGTNSSSASAVSLTGGATLTSYILSIVGNYTPSPNPKIVTTMGIKTGSPPIADPYSYLQIPSYSGCKATNFAPKSSQTISPGVYCGGISLGSKVALTLQAGTYIINGGQLSIPAQSSLQGSDVTIILTSSSNTSYPTVTVSAGASLDLTAPSSGAYKGIVFFQDKNAPSTGKNSFTAGSTQTINGALYFPNQNITYSGHSTQSNSTCTQLVGRSITINGSASAGFSCPFPSNQLSTSKLVE